MPDLARHRALVTGASSGIGAAMARILAAWGCDLTLTARRTDRLEALAEDIRKSTGVSVRCVPCDLSVPGSAAALHDDVIRAGESIDILINNAGFGSYQPFAAQGAALQARMIQLNVVSLIELTRRFLPTMLDSGRRCYILNVASIAAFMPVPYFACYAATKTFVRDFSEALAHELAGTSVSVTCVCPGGTRTEFSEIAGQTLNALARSTLMSAEAVAERGLRAMLRGRRTVVTGWINALLCFFMRLVPRRAAAWGSVTVLGTPDMPATPQEGDAS